MPKQIFKTEIPQHILYNLLEKISVKNDKYYIIDVVAYKKMKFHNLHEEFLKIIVEYYHYSKKFYVEREFTYNSFTNIVRQLCRVNNINFVSEIKYNESKYQINYYVYYSTDEKK